jgi:hypothetical protein
VHPAVVVLPRVRLDKPYDAIATIGIAVARCDTLLVAAANNDERGFDPVQQIDLLKALVLPFGQRGAVAQNGEAQRVLWPAQIAARWQ